MLACIEVLFIALELLIDITIKIIEVMSNIVEYFIETHKENKAADFVETIKTDVVEVVEIEATEVKEYIKPSIDILN